MCPVTNFKFSKKRPQYLSNTLLNQIKDRDYFYKKAKKTKSIDDWRIAKHLRNQTNKNIRRAKADFITKQLHDSRNDTSKFWRTIKRVFPTDKTKDKAEIKLEKDGKLLGGGEVADFINDFFINVGNTNIALPIGDGDIPPPPHDAVNLSLGEVNSTEIYRLTAQLNVSKSSGLSNLGAVLVKDGLLALNTQFTHLINSSLDSSVFPSSFKEATVIPIPKKGNNTQVGNYRPISLLPTPGKILEKVVHNQISNHLEDYGLINEHQYGFRKGRSTTHAVTELLNYINKNMNKRAPTVALFIDFKKAFDCLQYPILLKKLQGLTLGPEVIDWLKNYLSNRKQRAFVNSTMSGAQTVKQGVPQGSILGPLLYTIYANDIGDKIKASKATCYADDTVIYSSHKDLTVAVKNVQTDLDNLTTWCAQNGIYINPGKTKLMIFSTTNIPDPPPTVYLVSME